ncbi:MAG TPA: kinase [Myxococcales bacterium]|nr:kinase [Deltaproteobacteria bacterium]HAA55190.1 kinase [Myxococcales bacterium]|tara:strand:+ start:54087 stop:54569 length:483 start_codon:yes stop_codon:yes gene_type:complete
MPLVIFVGLQASGKSTFFKLHFDPTQPYISKDAMSGSGKEQRLQRRVRAYLEEGRSVVVDNTHPTPMCRQALIELGRAYGAPVWGVYFETSLEDALKRNALRSGRQRVPEKIMITQHRRMIPPQKREGFDRIFLVSMKEPFGFTIQELDPAIDSADRQIV